MGERPDPGLRNRAMPALRITVIVASALFVGGCRCGCLMKRQSETNCPTDIRQTVPWCAGEDAVFHCPCRPARAFYGHKPTCWGAWPTCGAEWRDAHCVSPVCDYPSELIHQAPALALPTGPGRSSEELIQGEPPVELQRKPPVDGALPAPALKSLPPVRQQPLTEPGSSAGAPRSGALPRNPFRG
jgi:hypothetical protein